VSDDRMVNEYGEFNGMRIGRGNGHTLGKSGLVSFCPLHISHDPTLYVAWTTVALHFDLIIPMLLCVQ
jgi:hypothetical protein